MFPRRYGVSIVASSLVCMEIQVNEISVEQRSVENLSVPKMLFLEHNRRNESPKAKESERNHPKMVPVFDFSDGLRFSRREFM